jgi:hypothetical protein
VETGKEEEAVPLLEPEEHLGLEGRQEVEADLVEGADSAQATVD